ncbi:MAG: hypothetical protein IJV08_10300 [Bacteroidaceae bacterium]|nr:hypothetical protein [Bacteroidaceae bacterium]
MNLMRNPLVWLARFRHRKGYGIHSPFAYNLVTQVLYTPGRYYADQWLEQMFPRWQRLLHVRRLACHRLLFRLANHWQPDVVKAPARLLSQLAYLHAGCRKAKIEACHNDIITLTGHSGTMFVIYDLQRHRTLWHQVKNDRQTTVTFDLWDMGIAVCNPKLNRQHYIINW